MMTINKEDLIREAIDNAQKQYDPAYREMKEREEQKKNAVEAKPAICITQLQLLYEEYIAKSVLQANDIDKTVCERDANTIKGGLECTKALVDLKKKIESSDKKEYLQGELVSMLEDTLYSIFKEIKEYK